MAQPPGAWAVLPNSLRSALILALATSLISGGLLFRATSSSELSPGLTDGDNALPQLGTDGLPLATPTPGPTASLDRSKAVLSAPGADDAEADTAPGSQLPTFGRYIYTVEGTEQSTAFGQRALPTEASMTIDRAPPPDVSVPAPKKNELVFDLSFGDDFREVAVVSYDKAGLSFTYESRTNTIDPVTTASEASYEPPVLQVPAALKAGTEVEGSSIGTAPDGTQSSIESWTVTVDDTEKIEVLGKTTEAWVVVVKREAEPGSGEQIQRTRRYWIDPARGVWVKWEETTTGTEPFGPGTISYTVRYTATLDRIEPI